MAPEILPPLATFVHGPVIVVLNCHCTVILGVPTADALKVAVLPLHKSRLVGLVVTFGGTLTATTTFCVFVHPLAAKV